MVGFARVVETRSFTEAARQLGIAKSVMSARVSSLERSLGVRLLQRSTRKLSVTPEGARFYERCASVVHALDDANGAIEDAGDEPAGMLRVSAPVTFHDAVLAQAVLAFLRMHPRLRIDVTVSNERVNLVEERVDLAIRLTPRLAEASLVARKLTTAPKVVCAAPSYVKARGAPASVVEWTSLRTRAFASARSRSRPSGPSHRRTRRRTRGSRDRSCPIRSRRFGSPRSRGSASGCSRVIRSRAIWMKGGS
jgi:DNA-binding transcriptional LysR family regulator